MTGADVVHAHDRARRGRRTRPRRRACRRRAPRGRRPSELGDERLAGRSRRARGRRGGRPARAGAPAASRLCPPVLPKPMPGSAHKRHGVDARLTRAGRSGPTRKSPTSTTTSSYDGACCMVRGSPCMCITTNPAPASDHHAEHVRVGRPAATSLTMVAPRVERGGGHASPCRVSTLTGTPASAASRPTTGRTRRRSSASSTGSAPGSGRLPAHVEHVGPRRHQGQAVGHGRVGIEVPAAVGEGVGGDVDDAHHRGACPADGRPGEHWTAGYRDPAVGASVRNGAFAG